MPLAGSTFEVCSLDLMHICVCLSCLSKIEFHLLPFVTGRETAKRKIKTPDEQNAHLPIVLCLIEELG